MKELSEELIKAVEKELSTNIYEDTSTKVSKEDKLAMYNSYLAIIDNTQEEIAALVATIEDAKRTGQLPFRTPSWLEGANKLSQAMERTVINIRNLIRNEKTKTRLNKEAEDYDVE